VCHFARRGMKAWMTSPCDVSSGITSIHFSVGAGPNSSARRCSEEIMLCHRLHTTRNRFKLSVGNLLRISSITSSGNDTSSSILSYPILSYPFPLLLPIFEKQKTTDTTQIQMMRMMMRMMIYYCLCTCCSKFGNRSMYTKSMLQNP